MSKKSFTMKNKKASKVYKCDGQLLRKIIIDKGFTPSELSRMMDYCSDYLNSCTRKNKISDLCVKKLMDYKIFPQMYDVEGEIKVDEPKEVKIDKDEQKYIESDKKATDDLKKRMDFLNRNAIYGIPKTDKEIEFGTPYGVVRSEKDLRDCIKRATDPKAPLWGSNLVAVRDILEKAGNNGLKYNVDDMRNDLLAYATKVNHPENWVFFVERLNLVNEGSPFDHTAQEVKKVLNEKYGRLENVDDSYKSTKEVLNEKYWKLNKDTKFGYGHVPINPGYTYAGHEITWGFSHLMHAVMDDVRNSIKTDPEFKEMIKQAVKEAYEEL